MTQWRAQGQPDITRTDGADGFFNIFGKDFDSNTESETQLKAYTNFTFSDLRINVVTLVDTTYTVDFRDDGVSSSNVSINPTSVAWIEDIVGSETVAADSLVNIKLEGGGMHGDDCTVDDVLITFEHASTDAPMQGAGNGTQTSLDNFYSINNTGDGGTIEAGAQLRFKRSQTVSNLRIVDNVGGTATFAVRVNGVTSTNLTVSLSGAQAYEDITGSDAFAADDDGAYIVDFGSGSVRPVTYQLDIATAEMWWGTDGHSATTREYKPFTGKAGNTTADDNWFARIGSSTAANLQTFVDNAGSGTRDVTLRIGSTDSTNLTILVTSTGLFEDVTGSEAIADGDNVVTSVASTGLAVQLRRIAIELPFSAATQSAFPAWHRNPSLRVYRK